MANSTDILRILGVKYAAFLYDAAGTVTEEQIRKIRNVATDTDTTEVVYEGDETADRIPVFNALNLTLTADYWNMKAVAKIFNKTAVTVGLPAGVAERTYFGEDAELGGVQVGFVAKASALELTTNAVVTIGIYIPVATILYVPPPPLEYKSKAQQTLQISALKTAEDIAGDALPGVSTDGCYWYYDRFS